MLVDAVKTLTEECGFNDPAEEWVVVEEEQVPDHNDQEHQEEEDQECLVMDGELPGPPELKKANHALGKINVPLTTQWVQDKMKEDPGMWEYYESFGRTPEESPSPIVQTIQYKKLTALLDLEWYFGKTIQDSVVGITTAL
jgi:hypothetical protein